MELEHAIHVTWPATSGKHKVVQLEMRGQHYLKLAEAAGARHADMLRNALMAHGLPFAYEQPQLPARSGNDYQVVGMGLANIDPVAKTAIFFGVSGDYLIGIDSEQLARLRTEQPGWDIVG